MHESRKICIHVKTRKDLGSHCIQKWHMKIDEEKIKIVVDIPYPRSLKEVQGFMGYCGYNQSFIFQYTSIAQILYALILAYKWTNECKVSFQKLRKALIKVLILRARIGIRFFMCILTHLNF